MGEVQRQAFGRFYGIQGGRGVARHAEIAAVHVQWMRHAEVAECLRQDFEYLPRRHMVISMLLVQIQLALVEFERGDAPWIHYFDSDTLRSIENPRYIVVDRFLVGFGGQHTQQEIIAAKQRITTLVDNGCVAHFHVRLACICRQQRRFEARGVAHLGITVAGDERGRHGMSASGAGERSAFNDIAAMVFGQHVARDVHLAAADMGVQI